MILGPGAVRARVQGSRPEPYRINLAVRQLDGKQIDRLAAELGRNPYCLAKLMTREMPPEIESVFESARVSLFPARASELETECSCPDWSNPCKHIAAVYYLLGEEFDRDPFLIFRLRGIDPAALLLESEVEPDVEEETAQSDEQPVTLAAESFWEGQSAPEVDLAVERPRDAAVLVRFLGNLPFWRGAQPLAEALEPAYERGTAAAVELMEREASTSGTGQR